MNTRNVNVKTATRKSSERYEGKKISVEVRAKQIFEAAQPKFKAVFIADLAQQIGFVKNAM